MASPYDDDEFKDRRQSMRIDMEKTLIDVSWHDEHDQLRHQKSICLDVSAGGVKLNCDSPLPVEKTVTVQFQARHPNSKAKAAKVLRCDKQVDDWYFVALQFIEPARIKGDAE